MRNVFPMCCWSPLTWPLPDSSCSRTDSPTIQRNPIVPNGATAESPLDVGSKNNPAGLILLSSDPPIHANPHKFNIYQNWTMQVKNPRPFCSTGFGLHQTSPNPPTLLTNLGAAHCLIQMAPILLDILWWRKSSEAMWLHKKSLFLWTIASLRLSYI